jgi:hypothetical protein
MRKEALLIGALLIVVGLMSIRTDADAKVVSKPKYCLVTKGNVTKCKAVNYTCPANKGCPAPTD